MPLTFRRSTRTLTGKNFLATGSKAGERIIVVVSDEVIKDHGEAAARQIGNDKYDHGKIEDGKVFVRTTDF